jgi:peptidoglycan/LPS O-acetylase OafA/YrhL
VVFYHLWLRYFPGRSTQGRVLEAPADGESLAFWVTLPVQYGYFGVTLFFVLSGFCIHLPQARRFAGSGEDRLPLRVFAGQRVRRLYPAYFASIVFTSLAMAAMPLMLAAWRGTLPDLVAALGLKAALVDAVFLLPAFPSASTFNGVYWTLVYELQFYAVYPVLLYAFRRWGWMKLTVALFAIEAAYCAYPVEGRYIFLSRWFEWYLGMLAAEGVSSKWRDVPARSLAVLGLGAGLVATVQSHLWPFRDLLLGVGFVGVLVMCVRAEAAADTGRRASASRLFKSLFVVGGFSYSLYLIHVPVIDVTWNACQLAAKHGVVSLPLAKVFALASVPAALVIGYAFFCAFERPFLRRKSEGAGAARVETPPLRRAA